MTVSPSWKQPCAATRSLEPDAETPFVAASISVANETYPRTRPLWNVLYFQSRDHLIHAFLSSETGRIEVGVNSRTFRCKISALERALGSEFLRVHKSFIVRRAAVRRLIVRRGGFYRLELCDGTRIPVSRRVYPTLRHLGDGPAEASAPSTGTQK